MIHNQNLLLYYCFSCSIHIFMFLYAECFARRYTNTCNTANVVYRFFMGLPSLFKHNQQKFSIFFLCVKRPKHNMVNMLIRSINQIASISFHLTTTTPTFPTFPSFSNMEKKNRNWFSGRHNFLGNLLKTICKLRVENSHFSKALIISTITNRFPYCHLNDISSFFSLWEFSGSSGLQNCTK